MDEINQERERAILIIRKANLSDFIELGYFRLRILYVHLRDNLARCPKNYSKVSFFK